MYLPIYLKREPEVQHALSYGVTQLRSIYVARDRVILKFEARVQIYVAVLNFSCEIQNSGGSVVRFSEINNCGISF